MADLIREPCPYCIRPWGHARDCALFGLSDEVSSLLYGYPVCQCCRLQYGPERTALHEAMPRGPLLARLTPS